MQEELRIKEHLKQKYIKFSKYFNDSDIDKIIKAVSILIEEDELKGSLFILCDYAFSKRLMIQAKENSCLCFDLITHYHNLIDRVALRHSQYGLEVCQHIGEEVLLNAIENYDGTMSFEMYFTDLLESNLQNYGNSFHTNKQFTLK